MDFIAHIADSGERQSIQQHLSGTSERASKFADAFSAGPWGAYSGWLHDIGKYSELFQKHIKFPELSIHVDHSSFGAQYAFRQGQHPAAFAIAGHHGGLPDGGTRFDAPESSSLYGRMKRLLEDCSAWQKENSVEPPPTPVPFAPTRPLDLAFFTKMLHSCLVDADFLDTEDFMSEGTVDRTQRSSLQELHSKVLKQAEMWLNAEKTSPLNAARNGILRDCIHQGEVLERGLYTLTVPTGGGKTFSSLAFAMGHAINCGLDRIIYVVPYTSIIDQTVEVFSRLLGEENVLAHYASADWRLSEQYDTGSAAHRKALAAENWDAPLIVTTAVQFFESLYAATPSRCRKLHNIANSVVIFDEAQTLPAAYLRPCVAAIAQMVKHYRTSVVLCTATQPVLQPILKEFLPDTRVKELCSGVEELFSTLRRTTVQDIGTLSEVAFVNRLRTHEQVLCVVNRRKQAQTLYRALPEEGRYCLTTLLCPADRKARLAEIRARLKEGLPCRVVSTSLIEAGVDVDFPVAYREEAGLDSVLQTAGRCNREGKRAAANSIVSIFALEHSSVPRMLRQNVDAMRYAQSCYPEIDDPSAVHVYFSALLYTFKDPQTSLDSKGILRALEEGLPDKGAYPFATVAERFRLIESSARQIYLPVGPAATLCEQLCAGQISRKLMRKLSLYSVSVYPEHFDALKNAGALTVLDDGNAILSDLSLYNPFTGLALDKNVEDVGSV